MIDTKWFVSYKTHYPKNTFTKHEENSVITDVTPARWLMYNNIHGQIEYTILYAEEISPSLAAELIHAAGIKAYYFKEVE